MGKLPDIQKAEEAVVLLIGKREAEQEVRVHKSLQHLLLQELEAWLLNAVACRLCNIRPSFCKSQGACD